MKRAIVVIVLAAAPVSADEVILKGGGKFSGVIVEQTADTVTVDIGGGVIQAPMSSVVRIEKGESPLQVYRKRAAKIPAGDAEAWRELARWAQKQALSSQAWDAWTEVVKLLPEDEEANRALGRVQLNGAWVTEEESYRARGYVQFEGNWMTPAARQKIVDDRQASEREAQRENQAQIQKIQSEQDAEKAQQDAEFERRSKRYDNLPEYDPSSWGWGAGPSYWPTAVVQTTPRELAGPAAGNP